MESGVDQSSPEDSFPRPQRERSVTPFLRSHGRTDGKGLVFNSRISPSPIRTIRRRKKRTFSPAAFLSPDARSGASTPFTPRNLSKEFQLMSSSESEPEMEASTPKHSKSAKSVVKKSSSRTAETVQSGEAVVKRYKRVEESYSSETKSSRKIPVQKSRFRTPPRNESLLSSGLTGSPKLLFWEGDHWKYSPRTGYTYANSLVYRERITPGRDDPMPHMARWPLHFRGEKVYSPSKLTGYSEKCLEETSSYSYSSTHNIHAEKRRDNPSRIEAFRETRRKKNLLSEFSDDESFSAHTKSELKSSYRSQPSERTWIRRSTCSFLEKCSLLPGYIVPVLWRLVTSPIVFLLTLLLWLVSLPVAEAKKFFQFSSRHVRNLYASVAGWTEKRKSQPISSRILSKTSSVTRSSYRTAILGSATSSDPANLPDDFPTANEDTSVSNGQRTNNSSSFAITSFLYLLYSSFFSGAEGYAAEESNSRGSLCQQLVNALLLVCGFIKLIAETLISPISYLFSRSTEQQQANETEKMNSEYSQDAAKTPRPSKPFLSSANMFSFAKAWKRILSKKLGHKEEKSVFKLRRSRRLQGLPPEIVEELKKARQRRRIERQISEGKKEDFVIESEDVPDQDDEELLDEIIKKREEYCEVDDEEDHILTSLLVSIILLPYHFYQQIRSFFSKTKSTEYSNLRRSRRLQGLPPEVISELKKARQRRRLERQISEGKKENIVIESEDIPDQDDEELIEEIIRKGEHCEEKEENNVLTTLVVSFFQLPHTFFCYVKSFFYQTKSTEYSHQRRSRRLQGLPPEVISELKKARQRRRLERQISEGRKENIVIESEDIPDQDDEELIEEIITNYEEKGYSSTDNSVKSVLYSVLTFPSRLFKASSSDGEPFESRSVRRSRRLLGLSAEEVELYRKERHRRRIARQTAAGVDPSPELSSDEDSDIEDENIINEILFSKTENRTSFLWSCLSSIIFLPYSVGQALARLFVSKDVSTRRSRRLRGLDAAHGNFEQALKRRKSRRRSNAEGSEQEYVFFEEEEVEEGRHKIQEMSTALPYILLSPFNKLKSIFTVDSRTDKQPSSLLGNLDKQHEDNIIYNDQESLDMITGEKRGNLGMTSGYIAGFLSHPFQSLSEYWKVSGLTGNDESRECFQHVTNQRYFAGSSSSSGYNTEDDGYTETASKKGIFQSSDGQPSWNGEFSSTVHDKDTTEFNFNQSGLASSVETQLMEQFSHPFSYLEVLATFFLAFFSSTVKENFSEKRNTGVNSTALNENHNGREKEFLIGDSRSVDSASNVLLDSIIRERFSDSEERTETKASASYKSIPTTVWYSEKRERKSCCYCLLPLLLLGTGFFLYGVAQKDQTLSHQVEFINNFTVALYDSTMNGMKRAGTVFGDHISSISESVYDGCTTNLISPIAGAGIAVMNFGKDCVNYMAAKTSESAVNILSSPWQSISSVKDYFASISINNSFTSGIIQIGSSILSIMDFLWLSTTHILSMFFGAIAHIFEALGHFAYAIGNVTLQWINSETSVVLNSILSLCRGTVSVVKSAVDSVLAYMLVVPENVLGTLSSIVNYVVNMGANVMSYTNAFFGNMISSIFKVFQIMIGSLESFVFAIWRTPAALFANLSEWFTGSLTIHGDPSQISNQTSLLGACLSLITGPFRFLLAAWDHSGKLIYTADRADRSTIDYDALVNQIIQDDRFIKYVDKFSSKNRFDVDKALKALEQSEFELKSDVDLKMNQYLDEINQMKKKFEETEPVDGNLPDISALEEKIKQLTIELDNYEIMMKNRDDSDTKQMDLLKDHYHGLDSKVTEIESELALLKNSLRDCCKTSSDIEKMVTEIINKLYMHDGSTEYENLVQALSKTFATKTDLKDMNDAFERSKDDIYNETLALINAINKEGNFEALIADLKKQLKEREQLGPSGLDKNEVLRIVEKAISQYDADKTGLFDYALETAGGSVISTRCTETYVQKTGMYSIFGVPIWYPSNNPRTIIQPGVHPGECWAFKGSSGFVVIQLSEPIKPTQFSLEHISRTMSPSGRIDSAPREFEVYGLRTEKDENPVKLGEYTYKDDSTPLQFFQVQHEQDVSFPYIELDVKSNHGNINYTCIYRFRVHGSRV